MVRSLIDTMATILGATLELDAILAEVNGLPPGENAELGRCSDIVNNILEALYGYQATVPSQARSITKATGIVGKSSVRD